MGPYNLFQQVVVITDATTSFGQVCAASFASRGARLVINFPPSSPLTHPTELTQQHDNGNKDSLVNTHYELQDAEKIVAAAIEAHGTVHVVINNSLVRGLSPSYDLQSSTTWDYMRHVVLYGAYKCAKAAWPHFRKNNYGRLIFIDSQATGCSVSEFACRFALFGFAETLAREGAKYDIRVSVAAPHAPYFVTGQEMCSRPEPAVPRASYLALLLSNQSNEDKAGSLYTIEGDHASKLRWERSKGVFLNPDINFTASALALKWDEIFDFSEKSHPTSAMDFGKLLPTMQKLPASPLLQLLDFSGRVVLVTGGRSGLGRAYSIAFAKLGAAVVVNDRADPQPVVDEIRDAGGLAIPVMASVEEGDYIVQTALKEYGHVDILINNAGFLRDKSLANMDDDQWQSVIDVHLDGTYRMIKAAWPNFVRQKHGCIINTTSTSGIYGNFGQSNYSAAKLGILGISEAVAREGRRYNIRVNTIAPIASTGGLAAALSNTNDKNKQPKFMPEYIVPIVLLLGSDTFNGKPNEITGGLFEVGCGWHASTRLRPMAGLNLPATEIAPDCAVGFGKEKTKLPTQKTDTSATVKEKHSTLKVIAGLKQIDIEHNEYRFSENDILLYNLSVGAKRSELQFIWEESKHFQAIPTFGVIPFFTMETIYHHGQILPNFNATQSLLGEVYLEILRDSIPTSGQLSTTRRLVEILDKDNAAVAITGYTTRDAATCEPLFYNEISFFIHRAGKFGGTRHRPHQIPSSRVYTMPNCRPDAIMEFCTSEEQAAWYRLTGDRMAMHIDPSFSSKGGFPVPILHGMCSLGIVGRLLFQRYGSYRSIKARFAGPVVPGQTLRSEMWESDKEHDLVVFQVTVVETGKLCIAGGGIRLRHPLSRSKTLKL